MRPPCPIQLFIDPSPSNRTRVINDDHHASTYSNNTQARPSPLPSLPPFLHVSRLRYRRANLRVHQVERHGLSGRNRHGWPVPTGLQIFPSPSSPVGHYGLSVAENWFDQGEGSVHASSSNFCACTYVYLARYRFGPVSRLPPPSIF